MTHENRRWRLTSEPRASACRSAPRSRTMANASTKGRCGRMSTRCWRRRSTSSPCAAAPANFPSFPKPRSAGLRTSRQSTSPGAASSSCRPRHCGPRTRSRIQNMRKPRGPMRCLFYRPISRGRERPACVGISNRSARPSKSRSWSTTSRNIRDLTYPEGVRASARDRHRQIHQGQHRQHAAARGAGGVRANVFNGCDYLNLYGLMAGSVGCFSEAPTRCRKRQCGSTISIRPAS